MAIIGAAPSRLGMSKPTLTAEQIAKKKAEEERKKRAEDIMKYHEKLDEIAKLEKDVFEARNKALLASPSSNAIFSPHLGLGAGGLAGLAHAGPESLLATQSRLRDWLALQDPNFAHLSNEKREILLKYRELEEYLRAVLEQYETLRRENDHLVRTVDHLRGGDFDADPYDYDAGADPLFEAQMRAAAAAGRRSNRGGSFSRYDRPRMHPHAHHAHHPQPHYNHHHHHQYGPSGTYTPCCDEALVYDPHHYDPRMTMPSPGFSRAMNADRFDHYGRSF